MQTVSKELFDYTIAHYHHLHQYPEIGFELPMTSAYVTNELHKLGIETTDRYGKYSVSCQIGNDPTRPTILLRADMDALPVQEQTGLPYSSTIPGVMHACGHDSHTSILLAVAKYLKEHEDELACNVRFAFQPNEEGEYSGAKVMVDNGVMDGVACCLCTHCEGTLPSGVIGLFEGDYMAACIPMTIRFHGKTAHATRPDTGIDALAMAVEAYNKLKAMAAEEANGRKYIWSVGHLAAGDVHNVIPDLATMKISFRFYDIAMSQSIMARTEQICQEIAQRFGGTAEVDWRMSTGPLHNDAGVAALLEKITKDLPTQQMASRMSSEDFAWFLSKAPGALFRYGIVNPEKGCGGVAHNPNFKLDEDAFRSAILVFTRFALNYNK